VWWWDVNILREDLQILDSSSDSCTVVVEFFNMLSYCICRAGSALA